MVSSYFETDQAGDRRLQGRAEPWRVRNAVQGARHGLCAQAPGRRCLGRRGVCLVRADQGAGNRGNVRSVWDGHGEGGAGRNLLELQLWCWRILLPELLRALLRGEWWRSWLPSHFNDYIFLNVTLFFCELIRHPSFNEMFWVYFSSSANDLNSKYIRCSSEHISVLCEWERYFSERRTLFLYSLNHPPSRFQRYTSERGLVHMRMIWLWILKELFL